MLVKASASMKAAMEKADLATSESQKASAAELAASASLLEAAKALAHASAEVLAEEDRIRGGRSSLTSCVWLSVEPKANEGLYPVYKKIVLFLESCEGPIQKKWVTEHFVGRNGWRKVDLNKYIREMVDSGIIKIN
jgi:hypothetical protein